MMIFYAFFMHDNICQQSLGVISSYGQWRAQDVNIGGGGRAQLASSEENICDRWCCYCLTSDETDAQDVQWEQ